jgi:hypothetical protein
MKYPATILLVFAFMSSYAQERLGIANSNYGGVNGTWLNPSSMVDSRVFIDIHLVGASAFVHNNYAYLPNSKITDLFKQTDWTNVGFRENNRSKNGFADASVVGPSAMLSIGKNAFGFHTAARSYTHAQNFPAELVDVWRTGYQFQDSYVGEHDWTRASLKQMTWAELAFSYARILKQDRVHMFQGGLTVKRVWGANATMLSMQQLNFTVVDENTTNLNQFKGEYAYTGEPGWNQGRGWAADLGFTYKRALNDANYEGYTPHQGAFKCEPMDYKYKIGLSVVDVGRIKFDQGAVLRTYHRDFEADDDTEAVTLDEGMSATAAAEEIFTEGNANSTATTFKAWMPTAASLQFDYNFENNFYLNMSATQRLGRATTLGVPRPNVTALSLRYERKQFEIAVPVSLYEYRYPMLGLMVRFNGIIIGTDNLGPWIIRKDLYRGDIYVHLKYSIFRNCNENSPSTRNSVDKKGQGSAGKRPKGKKRGRGKKNKMLLCPTFD